MVPSGCFTLTLSDLDFAGGCAPGIPGAGLGGAGGDDDDDDAACSGCGGYWYLGV